MSDPSVSPADTIRRVEESLEIIVSYSGSEPFNAVADLLDLARELLAAGERDKAEIARLRGVVEADAKQLASLLKAEAEAQHAGERDGQQIAQLTEALERICTLGLFDKGNGLVEARRIARAVLADEEDAE